MTTATYRRFTGAAAQNYQRFFVPTIATPVADRLLRSAGLQLGERVLDVACGTGVVARAAAEQVGPTGSVTGVDLAADMLEVAQATPAAGAPLEWCEADAAALPLPDASYDVVLCQMGLMFMPDRGAALTEARRVLAPGGRIVVNTPGRIQPFLAAMERAIADNLSPDLGVFVATVFSLHDPETLGRLLRDAGFEEVGTMEYRVSLELPPPAEFLWEYINLTPMGPLVAQAPEEAQLATERQFVEACRTLVVDGRVPVEQPIALASGRHP